MKRDHPKLSFRRQCTLLSLTRSSLYYQPVGENLIAPRIVDTLGLQIFCRSYSVGESILFVACLRFGL